MTGKTDSAVWPSPNFYFSVTGLAGGLARFQAVSGLEAGTNPIDYRQSAGRGDHPIKMPDPGKVANATLHRGLFVDDSTLRNWLEQVGMGTVGRTTIAVTLLDEAGAPKLVWTLNSATPTKVTGSDLRSEGNEVAVESVEIAYETVVVSAP